MLGPYEIKGLGEDIGKENGTGVRGGGEHLVGKEDGGYH